MKLTLSKTNSAAVTRALSKEIGSMVVRQQPGYPAARGRIDRVKKSLVFIPDAGGFRFRDAAVSGAAGTTFEVEAEILRHNNKDLARRAQDPE